VRKRALVAPCSVRGSMVATRRCARALPFICDCFPERLYSDRDSRGLNLTRKNNLLIIALVEPGGVEPPTS
jgi:hypothetical protein